MIQAGRGTFPGRNFGLHLHLSCILSCRGFFFFFIIIINLPYIVLSVLKCCITMAIAWGRFLNVDLTLPWGSCRYSLGDVTWRRFELELALVIVVLMIEVSWSALLLSAKHGGSTPQAKEDPLESLEIPQAVRLIGDVRLNIRIDTLQTYSIPKITPVVSRTWMVSFLSSWLKPAGDTGKICYILGSSVFLQTTGQLDVWLLYIV